MAKWVGAAIVAAVWVLLPQFSHAQGVGEQIGGLQAVLDKLYDDMIPRCSQLIGVGQGTAGFAAVFYIGTRVWRHIANAEPIDFYPLFRPFVLGFCIMFFPLVLATINGILKPIVMVTAIMVTDSNKAIEKLLKEKAEAIKSTPEWQMYIGNSGEGNRDEWYKYTHDNEDPSKEGVLAGIGNDIKFAMSKVAYDFENSVKKWMSEVLNVLYQAAALCINTLRIFQLIILGILGPLVFGFAVFDGLQNSLTAWLSRYINVYLWLPVANIFGAIIGTIQENMLKLDLGQIQHQASTFFSATDMAYLVFLIIGIIGYFTVPTVAGYIVNAGGAGGMLQKVTSMMSSTVNSSAGMVAGRAGQTISNIKNARENFNQGYSGAARGSGTHGHVGRVSGHVGSFLNERLSGKSK